MSGAELMEIEQGCHADMGDERPELEVLTEEGVATGELQPPAFCHEKGLWHRAVSVLLLTEWGEVVLEKRSGAQILEPHRFAIPEEHVAVGITANICALNGVGRRFGFHPDPASVQMLTDGDAVVEESQFPAAGLCNRERKTLYAYTLSWNEYQAIQDVRARLARQDGGPVSGELSETSLAAVRLIGVPELFAEIETKPTEYASGTIAILRDHRAGEVILQFWRDLVRRRRAAVLDAVSKASTSAAALPLTDSIIVQAMNPQPQLPAAEFEVLKVFFEGKNTCPGAYHIGEMMSYAGHIRAWAEKLSDPYERYVQEDIDSLRRGTSDPDLCRQIGAIDRAAACRFVREILHFPLENGTLLRNQMGNLEEITASRSALRLYLRTHTSVPPGVIENPQKAFNDACNRLVRDAWKRRGPSLEALDDASIRCLLKLNVLMNALDFHSPDFHDLWRSEESIGSLINQQFDKASKEKFSPRLGGDCFCDEFLRRWLSSGQSTPVRMVYFVDNNGQMVVSLKCAEVLLRRQPQLGIVFVPKNGQHGNDASWADVEALLNLDATDQEPVFGKLREFQVQGRFRICRNGPEAQGLNPRYMSQELCYYLSEADFILAEGQAYAEIRGWFKPTYLLFQVKGRVAEAVHGVSRREKALAFVAVGGGVYHFAGLKKLPQRTIPDPESPATPVHVWGQTTSDYVKAILSENYQLLRDRVYNGKEEVLLRQLREEAARTDRTVAQIILGTEPPTCEETRRHRQAVPIQVFAVGGGGGFNQVTLKALQMLGLVVAAGVPSTDDGGSTGQLQKMTASTYGYMFGVGDAAAILEQQVKGEAKRPILSFRIPTHADSLTDCLIGQIAKEATHPTIESQRITECPDFLAFVCEQLNLARVIDTHFLSPSGIPGFTIKGASIRNLNVLAAFHQCGTMDRVRASASPDSATDEEQAERAWLLLERAYGLAAGSGRGIRTIPVTYDRACLWACYSDPIPEDEIRRLAIPETALSADRRIVYGQRFIDQIIPAGKIVDFGLVNSVASPAGPLPSPSRAYLELLRSSQLFVMGAGSLFGSQLAQLAVPGVVDELVRKDKMRKVLILNHVCMNETMFYSLTDHIKAIERLANRVTDDSTRRTCGGSIRIGNLFTDIVVPRTVAREIDVAIAQEKGFRGGSFATELRTEMRYPEMPAYVDANGNPTDQPGGIFLNRYVEYVCTHNDFRRRHQITDWELRVLGFLDQAPSLYKSRSEAGRYRGAVYALESDINYLIAQGIPPRHIYEVESIAMNTKILKAEGKPKLEEFPGLIPESLVGIFKILLAKGASS